MDNFDIQRFIKAQDDYETYVIALNEIRNGRKRSHWIMHFLTVTSSLL